jgi:hypothetical protein
VAPDETSSDTAAEAADAGAAHDADRAPTPDEEAKAEEVAAEVDPEAGERYQEAAERGANVRGEGEIVPE